MRMRPHSASLPGAFALGVLWLALSLGGCGGPEFEAVKAYKAFLEEAKPSLTKMNSVRVHLFHVGEPDEMLAKFKSDLLPEVTRLTKLAADQPQPVAPELAEIHTTLKKVLADYTEATGKLVGLLESAKDDREREGALVSWGEADQKFGADMATLVSSLTKFLDQQMKR